MRILLLSQEVPPETGWGGIGTYVAVIAPALARAGHEVHVLSVVAGQRPSMVRRDGVVIHRRGLRRPHGPGRLLRVPDAWHRLTLTAAVANAVRRLPFAPDVVEAPDWGAEGALLGLAGQVPLVVRLHSGAGQVFPFLQHSRVDRRLARGLEDLAIRRAAIVTGTRAQVETIAPGLRVPAERLRVITCPVAAPTRPGPPPDQPRVTFVGRFEARKDPETLVRAAPRVLERVPGARFVLVGRDTGPAGASYLDRLRAVVDALGLGQTVELVDAWDRGAAEIARASVVAVPSRWESFGYVAAEASAAGRPVVASRIPALAEVVDDGRTGRLAAPGDPAAWADAIAGLLADPEHARALGAAGARRMAELCDPDAVAAATVEAYRAAIARSRRR